MKPIEVNITNLLTGREVYKFLKEGIRLGGLKEQHKGIAAYDNAIELLPYYHITYHNKELQFSSFGKDELALECYDMAMNLNSAIYEEIYRKAMTEKQTKRIFDDLRFLEDHLTQGRTLN